MRLIDADVLSKKIDNIAAHFAKTDQQRALMGRALYCVDKMETTTDVAPTKDGNKPRICEVLGVEVGEEWRDKDGGYTYRISDTGRREIKGIDGFWHKTDIEAMLAELINHPENIIRETR